MIDLKLEHFARARFWTNELPAAALYPSGFVRTHVFQSGTQRLPQIRSAAVELFEPRGGHFAYALLGGRFEPNDSARFVVETSLTGNDGERFTGSLIEEIDDVRVGLPPEYEPGIIAAAGRIHEQLPLMSGRLSLECAAHGVVGSSRDVFARVAEIVIRMIHASEADLSEDRIVELFYRIGTVDRASLR